MTEMSLRVERPVAPVRALVLEKLRTAIIEQRFLPGERLREKELCELTGVSRTSVREALRQLESEGLVQMVANKGPIVARVSRRDAREVYEVREVLEGLAGRLFAINASDRQVSELRAVTDAIARAVDSRGVDTLLPLKEQFYAVLFDGADNTVVARTLGGLHARITALRATTLSQAGRPHQTRTELLEIVDAIAARDADRAEVACRAHVAAAARAAMQALDAQAPPRESPTSG